ncbi:MAG: acyl-[acyl-carrier-protein]--UDP-N-acetylglucosamine O-acyltransferase, partial [Candidatus Margulisiibacteriota bacterium]
VVIGGYVAMGGHAQIDDYAIIGGMTTIHQFVRIGKLAMIGGNSRIVKDIPPFMLAEGNPMQVRALNSVGLMRRGVSIESQNELKKAFKILYKSGLNLSQAIFEIKKKLNASYDEIKYLIGFLEQETGRGILKKMELSESGDLLLPDLPELGI